ncbi:cardiolipin synthase [Clostridium tepidiprofundi DSM 19306]|uniref:Cardiolipin synthase n=1 Tax=Clostridium tepidiprofundi DSM 19306 TaxID=1121338 RepID=A0A151B595_9CLOT|nr:cardiolipin synthase [Clostridium tepidiprofundi]KYH35069.1 cardiolipin synthase [Clostridium tepidiprofundi DSM 19306]
MHIFLITILILFIANIFLGFVLIFIERKDPSATWAWLVVVFLMPIFGFILYLLIGQNLSRKKIFNIKKEEDILHKKLLAQKREIEEHKLKFNDKVAAEYLDMIYMHYNNSQALFTQNNNVKIFTNGEEKFNELIRHIRNAENHIHMVYYILKSDSIGTKIINELTRKAEKGIEVRLLYDAMGGRKLPKHFFDKLKRAGGKVACFFPSILPHINTRINYRNHRKIAVIDGKVGFVGGINIGDEYLGKSKKFGYWRDTHLKICGDAVDDLQQRFILDWHYASDEDINFDRRYFPIKNSDGKIGIQIVSSGPDSIEEQIKNGYLKMINSAKKSIYIQSPYFVPDKSILEALKVAALCGVDVRIMIPNKPDHPFVYWTSCAYIGELLDVGVKAYKYEKGFLHCKTIVVDSKIASVGTANMDIRSYKLNFEVNAFIYDKNVANKLEKIFEKDIQDSSEITKELYEKRSMSIKFKESISRLLSPIL